MSTKLTVSNLPNFRKSTLALHRINSMVNGTNETSHSTNHDGFDDLRHFIKAGGEFSKELATTLSDRAELEATYAKGLAKMAAKLFKVSKKYLPIDYETFFILNNLNMIQFSKIMEMIKTKIHSFLKQCLFSL